ncbi:MAG TPA: hypothetical protein VIW80_16155 [Pyrinomonadaceae bacterium]|jgi:hypothetical protein
MPKRIIDMVREKRDRIEADPVEAGQNAELAVGAIMFGITSNQWETYMSQFVEDSTTPLGKQQLSRLLATDGTFNNQDLNLRRAYMIANAVCGGASTGVGAPAGPIPMAVAEPPSGGGAVNFAVAPARVEDAAPVPVRRLDFLVNSIDEGLELDCLLEE